ncbi:ERMES complex subunit [Coemansia aciculifera]|uniref:Mitochondrial distribution and morphology protein 34 n=1 Tax=Coemansia aciculifera TaxID=417176 RepID=A0A9W8M931_9FUNG|nr:ERMES complex subunit [Coemansia aciculifera]KAJ2876984.1 ERMES complex subunit [Coemansia aciculifera]
MSFKFNWGGFPPEFNEEALAMLTQALNKGGNKPPNLVGPIIAKELDLGSNPPQLDILEISELEEDRFRAMFRMKYEGDGYLVLQTQVQANPLRLATSELPTMPSLGVVAAAQPLVVPMLLRISGLKLHGIIVLAVSKQDGITLVFRSDPLVSVEVHSTFDSVPSVRSMLQREIEATLRSLFQEDLPVIVHDMSVNEIRRARELKEKERRECIERQQQLIRMHHAQSVNNADIWGERPGLGGVVGADSGAASAGSLSRSISQQLMASQLHRRLMELSHTNENGASNGHEPVGGISMPRSEVHDDPNLLLDQSTHSAFGEQITPRRSVDSGQLYTFQAAGMAQSQEAQSQEAHSQWPLERKDEVLAPTRAGHESPTQHHQYIRSQFGHNRHHRSDTFSGTRMSGDPESLEQFLNDDWERMQQSAELDVYLLRREKQREIDEQRSGVVLRPTDNAVAARLASLMSMGQTLSPYTRRFEHTTMRSDVNPQLGQAMNRQQAFSDNGIYSSPPPQFMSQPLSPGSAAPRLGTRNFSQSGGNGLAAISATPYSVTTPPHGASGGRSPFPRNRVLRRKVHRIGGLPLEKKPTDQ